MTLARKDCEVCLAAGLAPSMAIACAAHSTYAVEQQKKVIGDLEQVLSMRGPALHPDVAADLSWAIPEMRDALGHAQELKTYGHPDAVVVVTAEALKSWIEPVEAALRLDREGKPRDIHAAEGHG